MNVQFYLFYLHRLFLKSEKETVCFEGMALCTASDIHEEQTGLFQVNHTI